MTEGNLTADVLRADDLLVLSFEFVNISLDTSHTPPLLTPVQPGQAAFVIVHFPPQHVGEQVFQQSQESQGLPDPPVYVVLANPSRLAFELPASVQSVPFTLANILAWTGLTPSLAPTALPFPPGFTDTPIPNRPTLASPAANQTAIELPFRLVLSPDSTGGWQHASRPVTGNGWTELWHTRLGVRIGTNVDESRQPAVRAIWTRDKDEGALPDPTALIPSSQFRPQIAQLTSDFQMQFYLPPPLQAHRLMLSALGAWTDLTGSWDNPQFSLAEWRHVVAMGRDQYVRMAQVGYLFPFGHRALMVEVVERKLEWASTAGEPVDYLVETPYIVVQEPVRDYTSPEIVAQFQHAGRELPFRRVRITTLVTPALDAPVVPPDYPVVGAARYPFHLQAEDLEGRVIDFTLPLMFVSGTAPGSDLTPRFNDPVVRQSDLRRQTVAFAPPAQPGDTAFPVAGVTFGSQTDIDALTPNFLPTVAGASVGIPAIGYLLGAGAGGATVDITYHSNYLQSGFDSSSNHIEAFAGLAAPLPLALPADRGGGLTSLGMNLDGITRLAGPVANVTALTNGDLSAMLNGLNGNLLGGVTLAQVISAATGGPLEAQIPRMLTIQQPNAVQTTLQWHPKLNQINVPGNEATAHPELPIVIAPESTLDITVTRITPLDGSAATLTVDGTLTNVALNLVDIVLVTFDQVHFHSEAGKKPDLNTRGVHVEFIGALAFVNQLAELLPADGFSDPPSLQVTAEGVTAGYSLGIPAAGVGAFSLENIALSAKLSLPFIDAPARLTLAFSERFHPFLASFSLVGGGGFLAVGVSTHGIEAVEGSLELGGNITVALGIVEANAHVMLGVHFGLTFTGSGVELDFTAYYRVGASVDLLGLIGISIDMYLGLTFTPKIAMPDPPPGILGVIGGMAALVVNVHLLFVSKTITLSIERHFAIPSRGNVPILGSVRFPILDDPTFDEMVQLPDWEMYCAAFA